MFKLCFCALLSINLVNAHLGHEHSDESIHEATSEAIERPSISGKIFEVVIEACKDRAILYLSDSQTNKNIVDAVIDITINDDKNSIIKALLSQNKQSYYFKINKKEGDKVNLKLKIKESSREETLNINIPQWPKISKDCSS